MRLGLFVILSMALGCKFTRSESSHLAGDTSALPAAVASQNLAPADTGLFASELIIPSGTFPSNNANTVVEINADHYMSCWVAGSKADAKDTQIYCADKNGSTAWTAPRVVVKAEETSRDQKNKFVGAPVLFKDLQGIVWLFYEAAKSLDRSASKIDYKISFDDGKTFSTSFAFDSRTNEDGYLLRSKPLQLTSGRFMVPVFKKYSEKSSYVVLVTPDEGKLRERKIFPFPKSGLRQPTLTIQTTAAGENLVLAYLGNASSQYTFMSAFDFTSMKFAPVKETNIPNSNLPMDTVTTDENQILIVYNETKTTLSTLSLGISADGIKFRKIYDFEKNLGENSYPSLIKDKNGVYHLTYAFNGKTIKYVTFDVRWLATKI